MRSLAILGRNLEYEGFKRGLSPSQLASELGISPEVLRRLRKGRGSMLSLELLNSLCEFFEMSPDELLLPRPELEYPDEH
jgi:DNA-binding Xre family transcriptional regulator